MHSYHEYISNRLFFTSRSYIYNHEFYNESHYVYSVGQIHDYRKQFIDWLRNVRIVLRTESLLHVLDDPIPNEPPINAPQEQHDAFNKYMSQQAQVQSILLASISSELQS